MKVIRNVVVRTFHKTMKTENKLTYPDGSYIFYKQRFSSKRGKPGIMYCCGVASNLNGNKARYLDTYCSENDLSYVRFDYMGHEFSSGTLDDFTISLWKKNTLDVLDKLTKGPQILVGSSMGGWVSMLAAIERPERVAGLITIANATDCLYRWFNSLPRNTQEEVGRSGYLNVDDIRFSHKCFIDSKKHLLLESNQPLIPINCPVRLLHGIRDDIVSFENSVEAAKKLESQDVVVYLDKFADHRFSKEKDLEVLGRTVDEILQTINLRGYNLNSKL